MRRRGNLGFFLLAVALLQFGYPVSLYGAWWHAVYLLLYAGMIVFGLRILRDEGEWLAPVYPVTAVFVFFGVWNGIQRESDTAQLGMFLSVTVFQLLLMLSLLRFIFRRAHAATRDRPRNLELILAAVSVYLLAGGLFAATFSAIEIVSPGSFADSAEPDQPVTWHQLMYFSYVTLATLGYGDLTPLTAWARSLATVETVGGTLFLTTVIARLVGAYVTSGPPRERDSRNDR
jgi:voltage-gated potassium channel Kch